MADPEIGYHEEPTNSNGILRARTTAQVRSWHILRKERALHALRHELETVEYPGVYILFEKKTKIYVGEAQNIYTRLDQHIKNPEHKIKEWDQALIISDGRPASQSDFNDTVVRRALESYLIKLMKANKYTVVSQAQTTTLNQTQRHVVTTLVSELNFFLARKNLITRLLEERGQEEIFLDELKALFKKKKIVVQKWGKYEALIQNQKAFIRPGSKKPKGWQITFRGRKPGSFIDCLEKGEGYLLVPRNGVLLVPLNQVKKVIDEAAFEQDTIDIWIVFPPEKVTLSYKSQSTDVTEFRLTT